MELVDYDYIKNKFNKVVDLDEYYDHILLSSDKFLNKYKYIGHDFKNFFEIRFDKNIDVLKAIEEFKIWDKFSLLAPLEENRKVYKVESRKIIEFIRENNLNTEDFIILNESKKSLLVKNKFNKLIGVGNYIRSKMKKNCFLTFGGNKILYSMTDFKKEQ